MNRDPLASPPRFALAAALVAAALLAAPALAAAASDAPAARPLMRQPTIHSDSVVFTYGGDLWKASVAGGTAVRLTVDDGDEILPRFSPDGSLVAFTAEYDGNDDVYVMSPDGGDITRVTYHPAADIVAGWHPVSGKILFSSRRHGWPPTMRLWAVNPDGSGLEQLPLYEAAWGSFSPDGSRLAYNRVMREHRTWKRYTGGMAQDIYLHDFAAKTDRQLTDFPGTDRQPMWIGDRIYFASDRDRVLNLYALDPASGEVEQLTHHADYDVHMPSTDGAAIVYELGGTLWRYDVASGDSRRIEVAVAADPPEARPRIEQLSDRVTHVEISPSGARALLEARGEVFTVPREHGPTRNLSKASGSWERWPVWSPDGRWVAYLSDRGGEWDIYRVDARGGEPEKLTDLGPGFRHGLRWSPDGKKIAFTDQTLRLYYLEVAGGKVVEVDRAGQEPMDIAVAEKPIHDAAWSPDSRWLAYSKIDDDLVSRLWIYSLADGTARAVSDGRYNDFGPVFTRDGRHLLFVSQRRFDPTFDDFEWEMVFKKTCGLYALTLAAGGEPLLPLRSDEEEVDGEGAGEAKAAESKGSAKSDQGEPPTVTIDFAGLGDRVEALPAPPGNYRQLAAADGAVLFLDADEGDFNRIDLRDLGPRKLAAFEFESREVKSVVKGVLSFALSADGSTVAYRTETGAGTVKADARDAEGDALDLSGLEALIDPRAEWSQLFHDAWRMERDFFYDPAMHGVDWPAMRDKYARLLPYVASRADIAYLIGELIGELNTSHTYVWGGNRRRQGERVGVGLLGVDWETDALAGRYRFGRILRDADWSRGTYPPLARPGIDVSEGDVLLAVDGDEVTTAHNLYRFFQGKAGRQVTLRVASDPAGTDAREVRVETVPSESALRYRAWVEDNRRRVEAASGGKLGYVHLPDTFDESAIQFPAAFYAQTRRQGLVVDGRFNGGGLDPDIFLQRLAKRPFYFWTRRHSGHFTNPLVSTRAHMVMLTNRMAGSGGDMLPQEFRDLGLGPIIGTRTWGGLVGVSMYTPLMDGGKITVPDYRMYDERGGWLVENVGVVPDVVVDIDPVEMVEHGRDAQLEAAIDYLLGKIEDEPIAWPQHEPFPSGI